MRGLPRNSEWAGKARLARLSSQWSLRHAGRIALFARRSMTIAGLFASAAQRVE
jgi:hypothetical protein